MPACLGLETWKSCKKDNEEGGATEALQQMCDLPLTDSETQTFNN